MAAVLTVAVIVGYEFGNADEPKFTAWLVGKSS